MGVFGEAIYGHDGQYKARVYNAQYVRSTEGEIKIADARGLTERDALNSIFANVSIGPHYDSSINVELNTGIKGFSWSVRAARQTGSAVSAGYCHAVYCESSLSSMHDFDRFIYFPFLPNGDACVSLLRNPDSFNAAQRWFRNMQSVSAVQGERNRELGVSLNIPGALMKRLTCYIVSQVYINARQYLYIRVPDNAPYEAYCLAALHDILQLIPSGLRAGISAATNSDPRQEQHFGILFQRASWPTRHVTDIDLHTNAEYPFLNQVYIGASLQNLLSQIVEYPEFTQKCFRTMERPVFGDDLPNSYQSYENYYGISTIQTNQNRASYLEECDKLLKTTTEPSLRIVLERALRDEFRKPDNLDAAIERDPAFLKVNSFAALTAYLQSRNNVLAFLGDNGIRYSAKFLYGRLQSIAKGSGVKNDIDFYEKVVTEKQDLVGLSEAEQKKVIQDSYESAWSCFSLIRSQCSNYNEYKQAAEQYARLVNLDERVEPALRHPIQEVNWYNSFLRRNYLEEFRRTFSAEIAEKILTIPDYDSITGKTIYWTKECGELIMSARSIMEDMVNNDVDPKTAMTQIGLLIALSNVFDRFFQNIQICYPEKDKDRVGLFNTYERTLGAKVINYTSGKEVTGAQLNEAIQYAKDRMPRLGTRVIQEIEKNIAVRIRSDQIPLENRLGLYKAAAAFGIEPQFQQAYCDWVKFELSKQRMEPALLQELYQSVIEPDYQLQGIYKEWSNKKGLIEKMKASRTLVKYLNTAINSRGKLNERDREDSRDNMWGQLAIQEKTISAFTASVSYLYDKPSILILQDPGFKREGDFLKKECRELIGKKGMGIYLDPYISISELLENVKEYSEWGGSKEVNLYTGNRIAHPWAEEYQDSNGRSVYSISVQTETFHKTLKYLLYLLVGEDSCVRDGGKIDPAKIVGELSQQPLRECMKILVTSGVMYNNPELSDELTRLGYNLSIPKKNEKKRLPFFGKPIVVGAFILAIIFAVVVSHLVWPNNVTKTTSLGGEEGATPGKIDMPDTGGAFSTPTDTGQIIQEVPIENPGEGKTGKLIPEMNQDLQYNFDNEISEISKVFRYIDCVVEKNDIKYEKNNSILLPVVIGNTTVYDNENQTNNNYYSVMLYLWTYDKNSNRLTLENTSESVYSGYIKTNIGTDETEEYSESGFFSKDTLGRTTIKDKIQESNINIPEAFLEQIQDIRNKEIRRDFSRCKEIVEKFVAQLNSSETVIKQVKFKDDIYEWDGNRLEESD